MDLHFFKLQGAQHPINCIKLNQMKIQLAQIKGTLRNKVDEAICKLEVEKCEVIAFFKFQDIDHQYSWRSKGMYIAIRYIAPYHEFQQYEDKRIYFKQAKKMQAN